MNNIKKFCASALVLVMLFAFAGCHKKDEQAVTIGDYKFTSAYYMCALITADSEAKSKVQSDKSSSSDSSTTSTSSINYIKEKVEDKDFSDWVKDRAMNTLKKIAAYKTLSEEAGLTLGDDVIATASQNADYYWSSYGYSQYYEPNGVSQATYKEFIKDSYYTGLYFNHLYAVGGEKEIAADAVKQKTLDNFVVADVLTANFQDPTKTEEITEKFNNYVAALQDGSMTFEQVYVDYNGESSQKTTDESTDTETPQDQYATIMGSADTNNPSDNYDTVKAMADGEVKLITLDDNAGLTILVKKDINADPYYIENLDSTSRHLIADDEFNKMIDEYIETLDCDVNNYAVNQFKVKKIKEPTTSSAY